MFDAVRNNKRIVQIFLGLIALPFAFWGIDWVVRNPGAGNDLASVGNTKITLQQFEQALRERQDQLRRSMGTEFQPEMMNLPQVRMGILNHLIDQRLLLLEASDRQLTVSNPMLREAIASLSDFQEDGQFSRARYETLLRAQGMSPEQFEARLRQDMLTQQLVGTVGASVFASATQTETLLRLLSEERQFSEFKLASAAFADKVTVTPEAVRAFYDENRSRFEIPEQIKAEYVVFSLDALMSRMTVSDAEIEAWYKKPENYQQPETRRASHILLAFEEGDREKSRARAEEVQKEVRKNPARFAALAQQYSQDPGSAKQGGDLGYLSRDDITQPVADALFSLKEGAISDLVESGFGYHIIKLANVRAARKLPLQEVRGQIEEELKRQSVNRQFAELTEKFRNLVYEQPDSLQTVAEQFGLPIERTGWIPKHASPEARAALGLLNNDRVMSALFSRDAIQNKNNIEAVEVAPNTLLAARVRDHVEATVRPFEAMQGEIEKILRNREGMAQALSAGEARLLALQKGEDTVTWSAASRLSRQQAAQSPLPEEVLEILFRTNVQKLPAYAGVAAAGGYWLLKITQVTQPEKIDSEQIDAVKRQYARFLEEGYFAAYLSSLRSRYTIDINASLLESRER